MVRHMVMVRWIEGATDEQKAELYSRLSELPRLVPEIVRYRFGEDLGLVDGNFDFGLAADFEDRDAWARYARHPIHVQVVTDHMRPIIRERVAVQYTW